VGSSATRMHGPQAIAIAISARWRIPPESSCGYRRAFSAASPTVPSSLAISSETRSRSNRRCKRNTSAICVPTRSTGFNAVSGSWNTIAIRLPRISRRAASGNANRFSPRSSTDPDARVFGGNSRSNESATVVLPLPDSPISARASPRPRSNERRSNTVKERSAVSKRTVRSRTFSIAILYPLSARG
jgi:hypothetical protein